MSKINESKRIKRLRRFIIEQIPKFPNNKVSKQTLEAKPLTNLLIDYINWAIRYVAQRPRKLFIETSVSTDPRWLALSAEIDAFLKKVERGEDLKPHLSLAPHTRGFSPISSSSAPNVDRWGDKDFLLNVMGYHHFHLGMTMEPAGHVKRTNDVLFASVNRSLFHVIGTFNHLVFEKIDGTTGTITAERKRLWDIFTEHSARGAQPGSITIPSMISLSGHSLPHVFIAQEYSRVIEEIDENLDNSSYINKFYADGGTSCPPKPKLSWHLNLLDLGLLDQDGTFFVFRYGPN